MEILKDLFDERIIEIIKIFINNPEKKFSLTDISNITRINITTTFRILNKLVSKGFLKTSYFGKAKVYQLEKNEKTLALIKLLKKETPLQEFVNKVSEHPRVKKIILEEQTNKNAKIIIVGDYLPTEKIEKICKEIKEKKNFKIEFIEMTEKQYDKLNNFGYNLERKIIWKKLETPS